MSTDNTNAKDSQDTVEVTGEEVIQTADREERDLQDLDAAWGDWTNKAKREQQLETDRVVADDLRPLSDPATEQEAFEVDLQDAQNDVEPGATGAI